MQFTIKRNRRNRLVLSGLLSLVLLGACKKAQYNETPGLQSLYQFIGQDTSLSLLQLALERSGLDTVIGDGGPYTIFAPENSAFLAAGLSADAINGYDPKQLYNLIGYQVIKGRIGSATLQGFTSDSVTTMNTQYQPIVTLNYYGLFINGIAVIQGNIALADGIVHKTGQIAFPPTGNILDMLDSLPNTTMAAYIYHKSSGLRAFITNPAGILQRAGDYTQPGYSVQALDPYNSITVIVPSDAAFAAYGFHTPADLAALDSVTRTTLVVNCLLYGTCFTSDFMGGRFAGGFPYNYSAAPGKTALSDLGQTGMVYYDGVTQFPPSYNLTNVVSTYEFGNDGLTLNGNGILTPPVIVQSNIVTTVGVVHVINQVFAPIGTYNPGYRISP
jgi:uncharacterized surface protein with fasciclin (FAS1) repeats